MGGWGESGGRTLGRGLEVGSDFGGDLVWGGVAGYAADLFSGARIDEDDEACFDAGCFVEGA